MLQNTASKDREFDISSYVRDIGVVIDHGGVHDTRRTYSPNILYVANEEKPYKLYYTGGHFAPERLGYRLLMAESVDGINFTKVKEPILSLVAEGKKHYSSKVVKEKDGYSLYYATNEYGAGYDIRKAYSLDGYTFEGSEVIVPLAPEYSANIHTLKMADHPTTGACHAYFTGSINNNYIYSTAYKNFDISQRFALYHFSPERIDRAVTRINFDDKFINDYGHDVFSAQDRLYMMVTRTDEATNCLYICSSVNGVDFTVPQLLLRPDESMQEMAYYGCSCLVIGSQLRIYYGVRYLDNSWRIKAAEMQLSILEAI